MLDCAVTESIVESFDLGTVQERSRVSSLLGPQRFAGTGRLKQAVLG